MAICGFGGCCSWFFCRTLNRLLGLSEYKLEDGHEGGSDCQEWGWSHWGCFWRWWECHWRLTCSWWRCGWASNRYKNPKSERGKTVKKIGFPVKFHNWDVQKAGMDSKSRNQNLVLVKSSDIASVGGYYWALLPQPDGNGWQGHSKIVSHVI